MTTFKSSKVCGRLLRAFLGLASVALLFPQLALALPQKVRIRDDQSARDLMANGGRLLADYGSFKLIEIDNSTISTGANVEPASEMDVVELNVRRLNTRNQDVIALRKKAGAFTGKKLHLVQFVGPIKPEWRDALVSCGVRIVHYVPQNAYLVQGNAARLAQLQTWANATGVVQWDAEYADDYKIHPRARTVDTKGNPVTVPTDTFAVQLLTDADENPATLTLIDQLKLAPIQQQFRVLDYLNVIVRLPADRLANVASRPDVVSIHPYFPRHKMDERQDQILAGSLSGNVPIGPGYLSWLASKGFTQAQFTESGFVVDVTDSGVDNGTTSPGHFGLYESGNLSLSSRVAYNRLEGTANIGSTISGCDGHGNLNSHIIAGYSDSTGFPFTDVIGFQYGLGVCPFVKVGSSVIFDPGFTSPDYANLQSRAYDDGARISGNSWGASVGGAYDADSQTYDALVRDAQPAGTAHATPGNQEMTIVFAAGNDGPGASTVGSPGTGKNIICVGAGEGVQAFGGSDGSGVSDSEADNANDIIDFSSRGPCGDGRIKPDICAPGTHISGGVGQTGSPASTGTAIGCYDASGVSGGVGHTPFFPPGQEFYTASSGTSHSTPAIAGCCALVRQYFINSSLPPPSPAMTKAFLMNSARYMTGAFANNTLPSNSQGIGAANLGMAFDGISRVLRDQSKADKFTASGQVRTFTGTISNTNEPFRVTLAWTDAPGSTFGNAYNNDLDLTVTVDGDTYKGNVFSGASSVTGGSADFRNNVESVFVPAGVSGNFTVTVTASSINSDGVPNEAPTLDQDFALVIYNATSAPLPGIAPDDWSLVSENCVAANGAVDPGETVTINFSLRNVGLVDAANVQAALQIGGGVSSPSGPQSYGTLVAGGSAVTQAFSFTAQGTCGGVVNAALTLTNNGTNLGSVAFSIPLGANITLLSQSFDSGSPPSLPADWTTGSSGGQTSWTVSNLRSESSPNSARSLESTSAGVNELVSPIITLPSVPSRLSFRHYVHLENAGLVAYDGGVLEINIGGSWSDIVTAGGSFVSGGYTHTMDSGNTLPDRPSWSGYSAGFITTIVNLPPGAAGQDVRFRWRCATDTGTGGGFWFVDSVSITRLSCCGEVIPPQPTTLVAWDVSGLSSFGPSPFAPTTASPFVAAVGLTRGGGVATSSSAAADAWGGNDFTENSAAQAITAGDFATFAVTPNLGYKVSFSAISKFDYRRSNTGPSTGVLQYRVGTGAFVSFATNSYAGGSSGNSLPSISLSGIAALQNIDAGTNVTFRIVNFGGNNSGGTWYVYDRDESTAPDLTVTGIVEPVNAPVVPPTIDLVGLAADQFNFTLSGTTGATYVVEVSTNVTAGIWVPVQTNVAPFVFSEPATNSQRFYRGRIAP